MFKIKTFRDSNASVSYSESNTLTEHRYAIYNTVTGMYANISEKEFHATNTEDEYTLLEKAKR